MALRSSIIPIPRPLLVLGALIPIVAALAGAARFITHAADDTYVRRDSFATYQAGESLVHRTDSLITEARNARIDTALNALVRACQRKRECP